MMKGIIDYLENSANIYPQKRAIGFKESFYSFETLKKKAESIGSAVKESGISGVAVPVFVNRSADTLAVFLGVAYSGNYYVPIDPSMPVGKISSIISDCSAQVVIGDDTNISTVDACGFSGRFINYLSVNEASCTAPEVQPDTPLYMVYTSGSTGKPKGVLKSHGSVMSFIRAFTETFVFSEEDIIGNQTPFFFDASAKDIYLSLYLGITLEVIPSEYFMLPTALIDYLNKKQVTYICWVPTALSMVIQMNAFRKILPASLKKVFFVGEVFPMKQLKAWVETLPGIQYVNLYGSSEIAGICCAYVIDNSSVPDVLPLGRPLKNCEAFLAEDGELIVASDALALEYYGDSEKTAERFCFMDTPSGKSRRVLKTGDLARYDDAGNLVFVSRKDFQIKHLGKRIELGEIESVADTLPDIQRCCCLYDDRLKQIKLYCQLNPGCGTDGKAIRELLREKLSDYMVPGKVIILEEMPYNANGKINRTMLAGM